MNAVLTPADASILRWSSTRAGTQIAELSAGPFDADGLTTVLERIAPVLDGCAMLIVRLAPVDGDGLKAAVEAAHAADLTTHICFAIDRTTLAGLDPKVRTGGRVGLLLDRVDSGTPLADVVHEAVEAIRFDSAFAVHATQHLRSECVLEAMLGLARNTGLCTLGPSLMSNAWSSLSLEFDYVPVGDSGTPHIGLAARTGLVAKADEPLSH
jgi:hypothetical protein